MMAEEESTNAYSNQKYWGEERQKDAIYAVYLKKVRYVPPVQFEGLPVGHFLLHYDFPKYGEFKHYRTIDPESHHLGEQIGSSANHLQWETVRERVIKAGSVEKLVESLITAANPEERQMDSRHFNVFFATYRAYSTPEEVLDILTHWYEKVAASRIADEKLSPREEKAAESTLRAIRSILACWADVEKGMYHEDFYGSKRPPDTTAYYSSHDFPLVAKLHEFALRHRLSDLRGRANALLTRFQAIAREGGLASRIPNIASYSYPRADYFDMGDYEFAKQRAIFFDVGKDNCVQIAEQLTFWDAVLFKELRPYQCQGGIWGRRHKGIEERVYSVRATIDQFNAVTSRVTTSIVLPECSTEHRAKILEKWIDIARELRALKNFSSLKAVIGSLQSEPVYRLKLTWAAVSKASLAQYKELSSIFETDENGSEQKARVLLDAEGTAKSSPLKRPQLVQNCRRTRSDVNLALAESYGTVPYLGSFLTDLAMLDQAHFDKTPEGLWNFERRREFEVLAKIILFQKAATSYTVPMDQAFCTWFTYLPSFDDNECYNRSLEIEPSQSDSTPREKRRDRLIKPQNGLYGESPTGRSMPRILALTKMFNNLKVNETPERGYKDGHGNNTTHNSYLNSSVGRGDGGTSTPEGSLQNSGKFQTPQHRRHRSNSTAPSTPAGTIPRSRPSPSGCDVSADSYTRRQLDGNLHICLVKTLASEFDPYLHNSPSYSMPYPRYANGSSDDAWTVGYSAWEGGVRHSRHLGYYGGASETNGKCGYASASQRYYSEERRGTTPKHRPESSISSTDQPNPTPNPRRLQPQLFDSNSVGGELITASSSRRSSTSSRANSLNVSATDTSAPSKRDKGPDNRSDFYYARVGVDDNVEVENSSVINYKCIKVINGDRMSDLIGRALEKHMISDAQPTDYCLVQLLPDGNALTLPEHCNPFYAVAPDPASKMLNFLLRKRPTGEDGHDSCDTEAPSVTKRANKEKRSNLLRWSSGYL